ncbi:MAG TPA: hypothetical protein VHP13_11590 [Gammaproteobacteria bacterium]|jgi:hypothetical protein|nr:hypothetical protein [Gammaproteobacteria bacterium]
MLRKLLFFVAVGCLVLGLFTLATGLWPAAFWLLLNGSVLVLGLVFERWRYKPAQAPHAAKGAPTGERFIDPETGALMEVYYDAATGERSYVRLSDTPPSV